MSSAAALLLALCGALVSAVDADSCESFRDNLDIYHPPKECFRQEFCCGSCTNRYCCSLKTLKLDSDDCTPAKQTSTAIIASGVLSLAIFIIVVISCCVCPCCCIYKICRKPSRPVVTAHTTTVINAPYPQQPAAPQVYQGASYSGYQPAPVPVQPAYGAQPMPTAPYQGQPYPPQGYAGQNPGPPPPYQETGPAYPPAPMAYNQAGYSAGQPPYPMQPPAMPPLETIQPAYNPAYVDTPKMGY